MCVPLDHITTLSNEPAQGSNEKMTAILINVRELKELIQYKHRQKLNNVSLHTPCLFHLFSFPHVCLRAAPLTLLHSNLLTHLPSSRPHLFSTPIFSHFLPLVSYLILSSPPFPPASFFHLHLYFVLPAPAPRLSPPFSVRLICSCMWKWRYIQIVDLV